MSNSCADTKRKVQNTSTKRTGPRSKISIAISHPHLTAEWHPTKNERLSPNTVTAGSGKIVWWLCKQDKACECLHEWEAAICDRSSGRGCPYHAGRRTCPHTTLGGRRPDIAAQWHPTKNDELTPDMVSASSHRKVWWYCNATRCGCKHEWLAEISSRVSGNGCRWCAGHVVCIHSCLRTLKPDIAAQWHPTKNGDLTPEMISVSSGKIVWWQRTNEECGCIYGGERPHIVGQALNVARIHDKWYVTMPVSVDAGQI